MIDSHCHLDFPDYQTDFSEVLSRTQQTLEFVVNVGTDLRSSNYAVKLAQEYDFIYSSVGIHPHDASLVTDQILDKLSILTKQKKVVAVGECGLDYARLKPGQETAEKQIQMKVFQAQIAIARQAGLALIVHCRDAYNDLLQVLQAYQDIRAVIHCFLGDTHTVKSLLNMGFYISFTGIITFKNSSSDLLEVVKLVPLERLLIETDSPFLAPVPYRGKRNEPIYVMEVAKKIADLKGISLEQVDKATSYNARQLFGIL